MHEKFDYAGLITSQLVKFSGAGSLITRHSIAPGLTYTILKKHL